MSVEMSDKVWRNPATVDVKISNQMCSYIPVINNALTKTALYAIS